jgi:hypothetical protein
LASPVVLRTYSSPAGRKWAGGEQPALYVDVVDVTLFILLVQLISNYKKVYDSKLLKLFLNDILLSALSSISALF